MKSGMVRNQIMAALCGVALVCVAISGGARGRVVTSAAPTQGVDADARRKVTRGAVRSVTVPVTVRVPRARDEEVRALGLSVLEDGDRQEILSVRSAVERAPLSLAVLVQDDLVSSVGTEIAGLAKFIRAQPPGTRVMVGYVRAGSVQIRQRFTADLERAAKSLRIPIGSANAAPFNPYVQVIEALRRFESQPLGRRALLLVSDGLDTSRGLDSSSPTQSLDLQRAINEAQRRSVAAYAIYAPSAGQGGGNFSLSGNAQGSLARLSEETGGKAFFQGFGAPVSFDPFLAELRTRLDQQFALTYLSTHPQKGFHRLKLQTALPDVGISYPAGYTR